MTLDVYWPAGVWALVEGLYAYAGVPPEEIPIKREDVMTARVVVRNQRLSQLYREYPEDVARAIFVNTTVAIGPTGNLLAGDDE